MFNYVNRTVPYTTPTGVQIGLLYQRPVTYFPDDDATLIQLSLLNHTEPSRWSRIKELVLDVI